MRIKDDFVLREIVDAHVLIPVGGSVVDFKGMMTLTPSGAFICSLMKQDTTYREVLTALVEKYEVEEAEAGRDLDEFLDRIRTLGVLDE